MLKTGAWRVFLAGALCGTVLTAVVGAEWVWWKPRTNVFDQFDDEHGPWEDYAKQRSAEDQDTYDLCLAKGRGTVACDALMRIIARERAEKTKPPFDTSKPFTPVM
jgi:hypothetical protein